MKSSTRLLPVLVLVALLSSCASNHLFAWARGDTSTFSQPAEQKSLFVRAGGTVVAMPFAFTWDALTLPFQYVWSVYPYGDQYAPEDFQGK